MMIPVQLDLKVGGTGVANDGHSNTAGTDDVLPDHTAGEITYLAPSVWVALGRRVEQQRQLNVALRTRWL